MKVLLLVRFIIAPLLALKLGGLYLPSAGIPDWFMPFALIATTAVYLLVGYVNLFYAIPQFAGPPLHLERKLCRDYVICILTLSLAAMLLHFVWPIYYDFPVVSLIILAGVLIIPDYIVAILTDRRVTASEVIEEVEPFVPNVPQDEILRGRTIQTLEQVLAHAPSGFDQKSGLFFGGVRLANRPSVPLFAVVGRSGSGKTVAQKLIMQDVLRRLSSVADGRAVVYDSKQDMLSFLSAVGSSLPIVPLNPFDSRSYAWDISADLDTPARTVQAADILAPTENDSTQFFTKAMRDLASGVMDALNDRAKGKWTLRDLVYAMESMTRLRAVLLASKHTKAKVEQYFTNTATFESIRNTVATRVTLYRTIAATWHAAERQGRKISLKDWASGRAILVIGNDETARAPLLGINRVLFRCMVQYVLQRPDSHTRESWFFLDEVRDAGNLDGLGRLMTQGRSKGAGAVLGFQDIEGLRTVYGDKEANELVGQCPYAAILSLNSPETAKWASERFGGFETKEVNKSEGSYMTYNEHRATRDSILPSEFLSLPPADNLSVLSGYYLAPEYGAWRADLPGELLKPRLVTGSYHVRDFLPRDESDQYLIPWDEADLARLGLTGLVPLEDDCEPALDEFKPLQGGGDIFGER